MSPTALTATIAATTRPFGILIAAEPIPAFIGPPPAACAAAAGLADRRARAGADVAFLHRRFARGAGRLVAAVGAGTDLRVAAEAEVEQDRRRHDRDDAAAPTG